MNLQEVKKKLQDNIGKEWVSDEPVDCIPYSRDLITDGLKAYPERRPDIVVMPCSTPDVQNVMRIANQYRVPVHLIGGGVTLLGGSIPVTGGITVDLKRMQGIRLDRENLTVTVEPGVFVATLTGYFKNLTEKENFPWRPYFTGAPGGSLNNATNIFQGINKFAGLKYGVGIQNIASLEIVLPDGSVLNTACGASIFGVNHWMQGPGPTLTYLPFFALGSFGICTKITWSLFPMPEACQSIWAYYEDFEVATKCLIELLHKEIGRGLFIMPSWTQAAYSAETREEGIRLAKACPKYMLGMGVEGTRRSVAYQTELAHKVIKKHGGRIAPKELVEVYRGHEQNIKGWGQSNSPRLMRHLGMIMTNMAYLSVDQVPEYVRLCTEGTHKVRSYMDFPEPNFGEVASGPQLYTYQWGHFVIAEFIFAYDHTNPEHCKAVWQCMHNMGAVPWKMGTGPWTLGRDPFVPNLTGNFYDMAKKLKNRLDPENIMNPGIAFAD